MNNYQKRCKINAELFMKTYIDFIISLSESNGFFEIVLNTGKIITIRDKTSWKYTTAEIETKLIQKGI